MHGYVSQGLALCRALRAEPGLAPVGGGAEAIRPCRGVSAHRAFLAVLEDRARSYLGSTIPSVDLGLLNVLVEIGTTPSFGSIAMGVRGS